jgi:predicted GNAT superfamily acetyltransferase
MTHDGIEPLPAQIEPLEADEARSGAPIGAALLALNNAHALELSWLEADRFEQLVGQAFVARRIGFASGLLIALDHTACYDSPNYVWFRARYDRFVYVDRVVIAPELRGCGYATRLYRELFARARAAGHERVVCEVTSAPPNPVSDAFHARLGFRCVGAASIDDGAKDVRYFACDPGAPRGRA